MRTSATPSEALSREAADYQGRVGFLLGAISNLVATGASRLFRRAFGIGLAEARLMYVLGYESVLTAQQAARIVGLDKAAISRTLATLERRGLVKTSVDSNDARRRVIQFTASGKELHRRLLAVIREREERLVSIFSAEEIRTLSRLLKRLHAHVPTVRSAKPVPLNRKKAQRVATA
jgi:DNA-binding MarR family transcriptional regulator